MLAAPVSDPALLPGWAGEPKWDGFRALVFVDAGRVVLRSRRGTEMGPSFPEVVTGTEQLPDMTAMDGELIVWGAAGRLAFERLQNRLARRGTGAVRAAEWPAHFVAFDLLRLSGTDTTEWPYGRRRAALESVFAARRLSAPWALCPSTTDPDTVREWLTWACARGSPVSRAEIQPGDLIVFNNDGNWGHVGLYIGDGKMVHAPAPENGGNRRRHERLLGPIRLGNPPPSVAHVGSEKR